jgi:hypothetical protein
MKKEGKRKGKGISEDGGGGMGMIIGLGIRE